MAVKVFILGRPGSGKSTAIRHIKAYIEEQYKGWSAIHFNDYDILQEMFRVEKLFHIDAKCRKFQPTEHGGFDVLDFSVLDTALKELEKQVRHRYSTSDELIAIEFARDDYSNALRQFSSSFLQDAYFLFLHADLKTCIQRIRERVAQPTSQDDHFVSEDILRNYYNKQCKPSNLKDYGVDSERVKFVVNNGTKQDFTKKISHFVNFVFEHEARSFSIRDRLRGFAIKHNRTANNNTEQSPPPIYFGLPKRRVEV